MEAFYWEEDTSQRTYTLSEVLLYAIVHHQAYAKYLHNHSKDEALAMPGEHFCSCPSQALHLVMAVSYDRRNLSGLKLQMAHRPLSLQYMNRNKKKVIPFGLQAVML